MNLGIHLSCEYKEGLSDETKNRVPERLCQGK
jgi:hypothetical protein